LRWRSWYSPRARAPSRAARSRAVGGGLPLAPHIHPQSWSALKLDAGGPHPPVGGASDGLFPCRGRSRRRLCLRARDRKATACCWPLPRRLVAWVGAGGVPDDRLLGVEAAFARARPLVAERHTVPEAVCGQRLAPWRRSWSWPLATRSARQRRPDGTRRGLTDRVPGGGFGGRALGQDRVVTWASVPRRWRRCPP
jgi:hypothetical protein